MIVHRWDEIQKLQGKKKSKYTNKNETVKNEDEINTSL